MNFGLIKNANTHIVRRPACQLANTVAKTTSISITTTIVTTTTIATTSTMHGLRLALHPQSTHRPDVPIR